MCSPGSKSLGRTSVLLVSAMLILLLSASCALAWPVENLTISPGLDLCVDSGPILIEGDVGPGDYVPITTTYVVEVPVVDGKFEYKQENIAIPPGTTATIKAQDVQDLTITTNIFGFDLSKTFAASAGKASVSTRVPKGNYNLVVSGNAAGASGAVTNCVDEETNQTTDNQTTDNQTTDKVETVKLTFIAYLEVKADKTGHFIQECCTERPAGEYTMQVKDKTVIVTLRDCSNGQTAGDGINGAGLIEEEEVQETSRSSGTGEAKIVTAENVTAENVTLQATPETNAEIVSANDVNEQPVVNRNSIIDYVWQILSWLGF
ncbi:hypothetical protein Metho_1503 [Methanomethylovorans hollandica DSM 15978]|uniref:Uncharacterized protein n=2 Tax=Methanomethylovorans hollandica TaxID=101192 RepID=L0KX57_METHD|nr:hypothetical protein Metho_1503 [Methanomethylovorans hollandica DSM 15978]